MSARRAPHEWHELVREYLAHQAEVTGIEEFAQSHGVGYAAFEWWLYRLTIRNPESGRVWAEGKPRAEREAVRVFETRVEGVQAGWAPGGAGRAAAGMPERDLAILRGLAHDRVAPLDVIALRHWRGVDGGEAAALVRLRELERRGYVQIVSRRSVAVMLTRRGARACGAPMPRRMHPRHLEHHLVTLRAIERYRLEVERLGGRFVDMEVELHKRHGVEHWQGPYQLEIHVQALERGERSCEGTRQGTDYDAAPDAVVRVALPDGYGGFFEQNVAIEYFTRSYSDEQVQSKMELHAKFDRVVQVCDSGATAERVASITGASATVLAG